MTSFDQLGTSGNLFRQAVRESTSVAYVAEWLISV